MPQENELCFFGLPARGAHVVSKQSFSGLLLGANESHLATVCDIILNRYN